MFDLVPDATLYMLQVIGLSDVCLSYYTAFTHPVLPELVPLVRSRLQHLAGIFLFVVVGHLRERDIRDVEDTILLRLGRGNEASGMVARGRRKRMMALTCSRLSPWLIT